MFLSLEIKYSAKFIKGFQKLPQDIREKMIQLEDLFRENPYHKQLQTKKLQGKLQLFYSFRITRDYRIIFEFLDQKTVLFLAAKHRKDIYK